MDFWPSNSNGAALIETRIGAHNSAHGRDSIFSSQAVLGLKFDGQWKEINALQACLKQPHQKLETSAELKEFPSWIFVIGT